MFGLFSWLNGFLRPGPPSRFGEIIDVSAFFCDGGGPDGAFRPYDGLYDDFNGPSSTADFEIGGELEARFHAWRNAVLTFYQDNEDESEISPDLDREGLALARALKHEFPFRRIRYIDREGKVSIF